MIRSRYTRDTEKLSIKATKAGTGQGLSLSRGGKSFFSRFDVVVIACVLLLSVIGFLAIASASRGLVPGDRFYFVKRQMIWCALGLCVMFLVSRADYEALVDFAPYVYVLNVAVLAAVLLVGHSAKGAQRWIQLGPFPFQPSEFAKVATIITLAGGMSKTEGKWDRWQTIWLQFLHVVPLVMLVLKQPDLGTSMVFVALAFGMSFLAGAPAKRLLAIAGTALGTFSLFLFLHLRFGIPIPLEDYQVKRLLVFIDASKDPMGAGYHLIQSKIAIGSGRVLGKRLFEGTQSGLRFLPEQHTDFIFSVIGEELGLVGCAVVLGTFLILIWRAFAIASSAKDQAGFLVAGGIGTMLAFQVVVNTGMTMGLVPVTGIPLPFVSYGGSAFLSNCICLGLLESIYIRRRKISF